MKSLIFLLLSVIIFIVGCSKENKEFSIKKNSQDLEMIASYEEGHKALTEGDTFYAAKKFLEAELLFPQSSWAPKAALMASYSYYLQNYYSEALSNLNRFIKTYPSNKDIAYAHYLIAICHYEMIEDEKRDSGPLLKAKEKFIFLIENYPNTEFAIDSNFKLDLIEDVLASKEMYLGRHYLKKKKWIAAIKRFKNVIENYNQTIFVEEALHRLVEINYTIGLIDESKKYAYILGYNYKSSEWYQNSYKIYNQNYSQEININDKNNKKGVIEKFKILFD